MNRPATAWHYGFAILGLGLLWLGELWAMGVIR